MKLWTQHGVFLRMCYEHAYIVVGHVAVTFLEDENGKQGILPPAVVLRCRLAVGVTTTLFCLFLLSTVEEFVVCPGYENLSSCSFWSVGFVV